MSESERSERWTRMGHVIGDHPIGTKAHCSACGAVENKPEWAAPCPQSPAVTETMAKVVRFACEDCDLGFKVEQHTDDEWFHVQEDGTRFHYPCEASDIRSGFARNWRGV